MADCKTDTSIDTSVFITADFIQAVINRVNAYNDKYSVSGIRDNLKLIGSQRKVNTGTNVYKYKALASLKRRTHSSALSITCLHLQRYCSHV